MKPKVMEKIKAGASEPPAADGCLFPKMSSDDIAYSCKILTEKYKIDPDVARMFFFDDDVWFRRRGRKNAGEKFRKEYAYGSGKDKKTIIWPGDTLSCHDESSGIMWVGVHGMDSICVVTRSGDLDVTRLRGSLVSLSMHKVSFNFRKSLIDE